MKLYYDINDNISAVCSRRGIILQEDTMRKERLNRTRHAPRRPYTIQLDEFPRWNAAPYANGIRSVRE